MSATKLTLADLLGRTESALFSVLTAFVCMFTILLDDL